MKRPVFSFRPNLKEENHRRAWKILSHVPEGEKTAYLVNAVLFYDQAAGLEEMIRRAVREEIQCRFIQADTGEPELTDTGDVPKEMFEFLSMLQEE